MTPIDFRWKSIRLVKCFGVLSKYVVMFGLDSVRLDFGFYNQIEKALTQLFLELHQLFIHSFVFFFFRYRYDKLGADASLNLFAL